MFKFSFKNTLLLLLTIVSTLICSENAADQIWEICAGSFEPEIDSSFQQSFCRNVEPGEATPACSGIGNAEKCLRVMPLIGKDKATELETPAKDSYYYDWNSALLCFQPEFKPGQQNLEFFRGFLKEIQIVENKTEYDFAFGCVFPENASKESIESHMCCSKVPKNISISGDTFVKTTTSTLPFTVGAYPVNSDWLKFKDLTSIGQPTATTKHAMTIEGILGFVLIGCICVSACIVFSRKSSKQNMASQEVLETDVVVKQPIIEEV